MRSSLTLEVSGAGDANDQNQTTLLPHPLE